MHNITNQEINADGGLSQQLFTLQVSSNLSLINLSMMDDLPTCWSPSSTNLNLILPPTVMEETLIFQLSTHNFIIIIALLSQHTLVSSIESNHYNGHIKQQTLILKCALLQQSTLFHISHKFQNRIMAQKNKEFNHIVLRASSKFRDSKLQYTLVKQTPSVSPISINFHEKSNKMRWFNDEEQKSNVDKNQQQLGLTLRSTMNLNSIRTLTKLKKLKTQQNLAFKYEYDKQNMLVHKIKLLQLYRAGNFSKVYKALLRNPNCVQVVVKKIIIDPDHKSREQYFAKTLKNPYVVNYIGTYITTQKQNKKQTKINKMLKDRYQIDNRVLNQEVSYLNIVMSKYSNNLCQILQVETLTPQRIKIYLYQMLRSLVYIHSLNICHRDIKPHNFVIKNNRIYLCDFGAAKVLQSNHKSVSYIFSRQYRAPQLLFQFDSYDKNVDMWAMGCVAAEMITKKPIFNGTNNLDQLVKILRVFGTPRWQTISFCKNRTIPKIPQIVGTGLREVFQTKSDEMLVGLIQRMMKFEPKERCTAIQALCDPYFDQIRDQTFYRHHLRGTNLPNFFYFNKKQIKGNEHFLSKLVPYWLKQHCKRFEVSIKDYKF